MGDRDTVRVQVLDGQWEVLGVDRFSGITPENIRASADLGGSDTFSGILKRQPRAPWVDIAQMAPMEYYRDGRLAWAGRIHECPTDNRAFQAALVGKGWQYHLDDLPFRRLLYRSKVPEWRDVKESVGAGWPPTGYAPAMWHSGGQVSVQDGVATLSWPKNTGFVGISDAVGVYTGSGPDGYIRSVFVKWIIPNGVAPGAPFSLYVRFSDYALAHDNGVNCNTTNYEDAAGTPVGLAATTSGTIYATASRYYRYAHVFLSYSGAAFTSAADIQVRLYDLRVSNNGAYMDASGNHLMTALNVAQEVLAFGGVPLLQTTDQSQLAAATFGIPDFPMEYETPRRILDRAYGYEDQFVGVDTKRRLFAKVRSSTPTVRIINDQDFKDTSAGSGDDTYSSVVVNFTDASGRPRVVRRHAGIGGTPNYRPSTTAILANPSFAVDTSGWAAGAGATITRDTVDFESTPASGRIDNAGGTFGFVETVLSGGQPGRLYQLKIREKSNQANAAFDIVDYNNRTLGVSGGQTVPDDTYRVSDVSAGSGAYNTRVVTFMWPGIAQPYLRITTPASALFVMRIDSIEVYESVVNAVEARGFQRGAVLQAQAALTLAAAQRLADLWLLLHQRTPLKGTVSIAGSRDASTWIGGDDVPAVEMLGRTGEYAHLGNLRDPDTAGLGRDGLVVKVEYDAENDQAAVTIDNERASFEKLLSRMGVVQEFLLGGR